MVLSPWTAARRNRYRLAVAAVLFFSLAFVLHVYRTLARRADPPPLEATVLPESVPPGHYDWTTPTSFSPVSPEEAASSPLDRICHSFPTGLLDDIQPVLKSGAGVVERLAAHLHADSACLSNLIIVSDLDGELEGRRIVDVIREIPSPLREDRQLDPWRSLHQASTDGPASEFDPKAYDGWRTDKFKFLASVSYVWRERPMKAWYVFFEGDTYIFWDAVFRMLANLDPDEPLYFGSPTPGRGGTWFANGGPGYILSRAAVQRLVVDDYHRETGEYLGSILSETEWDNLLDDCCGDSVLGWALAKRGVLLSGLYPMFTPYNAHTTPFTDRLWCQPLMGMHRSNGSEEVLGLARWEWSQRKVERPLLYRDLALSYYALNSASRRKDWDYGKEESFPAPAPGELYPYDPHASVDNCENACNAHGKCLQWNYHLNHCRFTRLFRMGEARAPGGRDASESWWHSVLKSLRLVADPAKDAPESLRYFTGWNTRLIQEWADRHPCDHVQWVKPSVKRIF